MAYIGKVSVSSEWEAVEDLIHDQVPGQGGFAFDSNKTYSLQADSFGAKFGVRLCNSSAQPQEADDGEYLIDEQFGVYKPDGVNQLWVKRRGNSSGVKLSVSEN